MTEQKCKCGEVATHYMSVIYVTYPYGETDYLDRYVCGAHADPSKWAPLGSRFLAGDATKLPVPDLPEHALPELQRMHSGYECWRKDLDAHGLVTANLMHPEND